MIEIIFPTIPRWHCIDLVLKNIELAEKPEDIQILCVVSGDQKYTNYVERRMKKIFKKVRIVHTKNPYIEHDQLRAVQYENRYAPDKQISVDKLEMVYKTYQIAIDNLDKSADYYWFIEDDTLFPLDTYSRYMNTLKDTEGDIVTGVSYYWHTLDNMKRNFWNIEINKTFGDNDTSKEGSINLVNMTDGTGVVKLGASGLGNVIAKKEVVLSWQPKSYLNLQSGADISFFVNAIKNNFKAYGMWNLYLPHITKHCNGDVEIRGRIDFLLSNKLFRN